MNTAPAYNKESFIQVRDRGWNNFTVYYRYCLGLDLEYLNSKLTGWKINDTIGLCAYGKTKTDFLMYLERFIDNLGLKKWVTKGEKKDTTFKNVVIIWVKKLNPVRAFFHDLVTEEFGNIYIQLLDFFEFREIGDWNDDMKKAEMLDVVKYGQKILDDVFIPNRYYYITPIQPVRKKLKKGAKDYEEFLKEINPKDWTDFKYLRSALFGGIVYCPYKGRIFKEKLLALDMNSAYIFALLCCKHVMSAATQEDPKNYRLFIGSSSQLSLGTYTITYICDDEYIGCFHDVDEVPFETGMHTVKTIMTNIDLETFLSMVTPVKIECSYLESYEADYLPDYVRDVLIEEYCKKNELKKTRKKGDAELITQKKAVNGVFGQTIEKIANEIELRKKIKHPYLACAWGIFCTAYAKRNLMMLASKVQGWIYSDTDSVYCYDNVTNREWLEKVNKRINKEVKTFCKQFGYDFEKLSMLGSFDLEAEIKYFRAFKRKEYFYITVDDKIVVKSAGIEKRDWTMDLLKEYKMLDPKTTMIPAKITVPIMGDDYYEEETFEGEAALFMADTMYMLRDALEGKYECDEEDLDYFD